MFTKLKELHAIYKAYGKARSMNSEGFRKFWMTILTEVIGAVILGSFAYFGLPESMAETALNFALGALGLGVGSNLVEHVTNTVKAVSANKLAAKQIEGGTK